MELKGNVLSGLDVLLGEQLDSLKGLGVGIVTNHAAVTRDLDHITDALHAAGVNVVALFGPEHGVRGDAAEGAAVEDSVDPRLGVPVYSLYGATSMPTQEMLEGIDVMLIDIQDVGARFYTFPYTMAAAMEACGKYGVKVWVLDRPNPITGLGFEGPLLDPEYKSGVGKYRIPVRHGFTSGELARLYNTKFGVECDLEVVRMKNWSRDMWFDETGLPWVLPSPNMPTLDTATVYTGTCFFEGTNVSEGRGLSRPFEIFGAPWIDAQVLRKEMMSYDLPGVAYREAYFSPFEWKFRKEPCSGLQVYVTDRNVFKPVITGIAAVATIKRLWPDDFMFRPPSSTGKCFFDLLAGSPAVREMIDANVDLLEMEKTWEKEPVEFMAETKSILLY
ncbi:MAG: exo-beta-N-acetylmuramidase NamZ domain-containing protein [Armatimonadota bacterium]|jgi:uncharacterized protein YbbC (DUF1343 family)